MMTASIEMKTRSIEPLYSVFVFSTQEVR